MTLALGILIPFVPAFSAPTPKAGAICAKQGITQTYSGKKYTCVKSGKKLVWYKGVVIKKAAPTPTPSSSIPTPTPTPQVTPTPEFSPTVSASQTPTTISSPTPSNSFSAMPTPTSVQTPERSKQKTSLVTYLPPTKPSANIEICKIREVSSQRGGTITGFPRIDPPLYAKSGTIKWAIVPIDFSDLPGEKTFLNRIADQMELSSEWEIGRAHV